jgi:thioredoxin reductase
LETSILGAGPYGLSIAAHLRAARQPFEIFGTPLESWRFNMPEGMILKSEPFASNLWDPRRRYSLARYFATLGLPYQPVANPLSLSRFLEYAEWFRQNAVGVTNEVKVTQLSRVDGGYALRLADGRLVTSRRVILATGHMAFRQLPANLAHISEPLMMHSARIGPIERYSRRDVVVIGAGQSALETAALLHETGARVRMLVRRRKIEWNAPSKPRPLLSRIRAPDAGVASGWKSVAISELPRLFRWCFAPTKRHRFVANSYGPSGSWWLRDRVNNRIEVSLSATIDAALETNGRLRLTVRKGGHVDDILADHVIAATGFRIDIDRCDYLDHALRQTITREVGGIPALDSHFETSSAGLFIVGIPSSPVFGPIMRFMYGAKHAAPILANHLKRRGPRP